MQFHTVFGYKNNSQQRTGVPLALGCSERYNMLCVGALYLRSNVCRSGVGSAGAVFIYQKLIWHKIVMQSRYNMSSYYNGGVPMINKQYNPINWSDYDPHNETCMDTNDSYFTAELPEDERQLCIF